MPCAARPGLQLWGAICEFAVPSSSATVQLAWWDTSCVVSICTPALQRLGTWGHAIHARTSGWLLGASFTAEPWAHTQSPGFAENQEAAPAVALTQGPACARGHGATEPLPFAPLPRVSLSGPAGRRCGRPVSSAAACGPVVP